MAGFSMDPMPMKMMLPKKDMPMPKGKPRKGKVKKPAAKKKGG